MMTGKSSLPEDKKVASKDSHIKRKERERKRDFWETFGLEESYLTLRLRDTTNFYSNAEERKLTNSSHRDLLILYKILSYAHSTRTLNPNCICNSDLINEHNGGCRHHSLSRTTLKKIA